MTCSSSVPRGTVSDLPWNLTLLMGFVDFFGDSIKVELRKNNWSAEFRSFFFFTSYLTSRVTGLHGNFLNERVAWAKRNRGKCLLYWWGRWNKVVKSSSNRFCDQMKYRKKCSNPWIRKKMGKKLKWYSLMSRYLHFRWQPRRQILANFANFLSQSRIRAPVFEILWWKSGTTHS